MEMCSHYNKNKTYKDNNILFVDIALRGRLKKCLLFIEDLNIITAEGKMQKVMTTQLT